MVPRDNIDVTLRVEPMGTGVSVSRVAGKALTIAAEARVVTEPINFPPEAALSFCL